MGEEPLLSRQRRQSQTFRERGKLDENGYCFSIPRPNLCRKANGRWDVAMAGNTGDCDDPDAPEGAYEYYCCCTITLEENGWHGEMCGTSW